MISCTLQGFLYHCTTSVHATLCFYTVPVHDAYTWYQHGICDACHLQAGVRRPGRVLQSQSQSPAMTVTRRCRPGPATGTGHWHWNSRLALPGSLEVLASAMLAARQCPCIISESLLSSDAEHTLVISRHSVAPVEQPRIWAG